MSKSSGKGKLGAAAVAFVVFAGMGHGKHHHLGLGSLDSLGATAAPSSSSRNVHLGERMAAHRGWTGGEFSCLYTLWEGESGWDKYATYPSTTTSPSTPGADITTAYGIPQALPAQKMATAGANWQTSARTQIRWGLDYINRTYGSPCAALAFKRAHGNAGY